MHEVGGTLKQHAGDAYSVPRVSVDRQLWHARGTLLIVTSAEKLLVAYTGCAGEGVVFAPDGSGWAVFRTPAVAGGPLVFLRFAATGGRKALTIQDVFLSSVFRSLDSRDLRAVPLGRLTAVVNRPGELPRLLSAAPDVGGSTRPFPEDLYMDEGFPWWLYEPQRPRAPRLRLKIPSGVKKPDSFYAQVAERFAYLAGMSSRPASDLAKANDVPVTTVHGWVKEARRRGLLAAGERARREAGS